MLFREQGIMIASMLTAIRMAIGVLVEALLPGGGGTGTASGGEPPPKDEAGLKEWIRSKLKALALLLGRLGIKAAEALPRIIGAIISWVLKVQMKCFFLFPNLKEQQKSGRLPFTVS